MGLDGNMENPVSLGSSASAPMISSFGGTSNTSSFMTTQDKKMREEWLSMKVDQSRAHKEKEELAKRDQIQEHHQRLWSPYIREVTRTQELNIAWKQELGFFSWERVLPFRELIAFRITGHNQLRTIPDTFPLSLQNLTTLSLIANGLQTLPENIGLLKSLTEIDVTKNQLRRLPDSITTLPHLTVLNLSSNELEALPEQFGNLIHLEKIWVEKNRLQFLPTSIGLLKAKSAVLNCNQLRELPETIGQMVSLTSLSVNMNQLTEFPDSLIQLTQLTSLSACNNKLTTLPRNIGSMHITLKQLRLDYNQIQELPFSFRFLKGLKGFSMEKNPLKLPPIDIIYKGIQVTTQYIEKSFEEFVRKSRREIINTLQELLAFGAKELLKEREGQGSTIPTITTTTTERKERTEEEDDEEENNDKSLDQIIAAYFESDVEVNVRGEKLQFYAIVWSEFYEIILPALEKRQRLLKQHLLSPSLLPGNNTSKKTTGSSIFVSFLEKFTQEEVEDALQHYDDDFSIACLSEEKACDFRRCACMERIAGKLRRKVCIPGQRPYRCHRFARLIRMQMLTHEEAKEQLANSYLKKKIQRLVDKIKKKAVEYINSQEGIDHFEKLAVQLGKELFCKRRLVKKALQKKQQAQQKMSLKRQQVLKEMDTYRTLKQKKVTKIKQQIDTLLKEQEQLLEKKSATTTISKAPLMIKSIDDKIDKISLKIQDLEDQLKNQDTREDQKMLKLELVLEKLDQDQEQVEVEAAKAAAQAEKEDEEEEEEEEEEEDDDDDEEEEGGDEEEEEEEEEEEKEKTPVVAAASTKEELVSSSHKKAGFFTVEMPDMHVLDYRKAAIRNVENVLGERDANVEELTVLFQSHARDAYVAEKCLIVEKKATYEFLQMRTVLRRWMGHGHRAIFEAWRDFIKENVKTRDKTELSEKRNVQLEEENQGIEEELAKIEAAKWIQRIDMYSDAVYYEHSITGETKWEPPKYWQQIQTSHQIPILKLPPI